MWYEIQWREMWWYCYVKCDVRYSYMKCDDIVMWNVMWDSYMKCDDIVMWNVMWDTVTWNVMILLSENGCKLEIW